MNALSKPRHPLIEQALTDARAWCAGHVIDERPALVHAVRVAATVDYHQPAVAPDVVAAALLHDSPEFAPPRTNLSAHYGPGVARIVAALNSEHLALDQPDPPISVANPSVLLVSTADKAVALSSLLRRARASGDADAFFTARPALLNLLPHFATFHRIGVGEVPRSLSAQLGAVLDRLDDATRTARLAGTRS